MAAVAAANFVGLVLIGMVVAAAVFAVVVHVRESRASEALIARLRGDAGAAA